MKASSCSLPRAKFSSTLARRAQLPSPSKTPATPSAFSRKRRRARQAAQIQMAAEPRGQGRCASCRGSSANRGAANSRRRSHGSGDSSSSCEINMKYLIFSLLLAAPLALMAQAPGVTNAVASLKKEAQTATDPETKSLAGDLSTKVAALSKSLQGNPEAQKQLEGAVNALLGDKGPAAIE